MARERSPGVRLLFAALVAAALVIPLMMVYALVYDRQDQAQTAQNSIVAGWAGPQVVAGPILALPYLAERVTSEVVDGRTVTRTIESREMLYIASDRQEIDTAIDPSIKSRGVIHQSVIYDVALSGNANFTLPDDLARLGVDPDQLLLDEAEVRLPISDPRGIGTETRLSVDGEDVAMRPGMGANASGSGIHGQVDWSDGEPLSVEFAYNLKGSSSLSVVPRGKETAWTARSTWPHPSFSGSFLPPDDSVSISDEGFEASWSVSNLALGESLVRTSEPTLPQPAINDRFSIYPVEAAEGDGSVATIRLVEPVDLYSLVNRSVKYGFLFIGFTFLAFLMFDIVGGARVASAEYLLTGAGLVLFFVMLLAFSEMFGFAWAYVLASGAIIALLTSYSAAVLGTWRRASVIGAMLVGLYALLYVLLNLESWSLVIGSVLLFVALAAVMYATRQIDWSEVNYRPSSKGSEPAGEASGIPA
ncbi:MAG: cell envelope integrity protein CreD [Pseudomonadota bacterium]